jgi:hypothetical protein
MRFQAFLASGVGALLICLTACQHPVQHEPIELLAISDDMFRVDERGMWVICPSVASNIFAVHLRYLERKNKEK